MWEWFFDGIGTELVSLIVGTLFGGIAGYNVGVRSKSRQCQKSGDNSNQYQSNAVVTSAVGNNNSKINSKVVQKQNAGNNATQMQNGGINDERH